MEPTDGESDPPEPSAPSDAKQPRPAKPGQERGKAAGKEPRRKPGADGQRPELGGGRGVAAGLRLMEAPRWRRELDLRERCRARGATTDAAIVDVLAADLLAVELSPEARAALVEYVRAERTALELPEGALLERKAYGEGTLRALAHLILSLPEAQLN